MQLFRDEVRNFGKLSNSISFGNHSTTKVPLTETSSEKDREQANDMNLGLQL